MNNYELTLLINDAKKNSLFIAKEIENIIKEKQGIIGPIKELKKINLAYPIEKNLMADIAIIEFSIIPAQISLIEKEIKLNKNILRYILIKKIENIKTKKNKLKKCLKTNSIEKEDKLEEKSKIKLTDIGKKLDEML